MPLAPYPYRYRPYSGDDPNPISPVALIPPDDETSPAFDPSLYFADNSQTQNPVAPAPQPIPAPPSLTNRDLAAAQIPLSPLRDSAQTPQPSDGGGNNGSGLRQLARMPHPGAASLATATAPDVAALEPPPALPIQPAAPSPVLSASPAPLGPPPQRTSDAAAQDLQRTEQAISSLGPPKSNWAQNLAGALLAMTKLAPVANQIIHPKWSQQMAGLQSQQAQQEEALKNATAMEQAQALEEQRRGMAAQRNAQAQYLSGKALAHPGQVQLDPDYAKENLPWLLPDTNGDFWVDKEVANNLSKPEKDVRPVTVAPGTTLVDPETGKVLYQAPNKPVADKIPSNMVELQQAIQTETDPTKRAQLQSAFDAEAKRELGLRTAVTIMNQAQQAPVALPSNIPPAPAGQKNDAYLQTLPLGDQNIIKQWSEGRAPLPSSFALKDKTIQKWYQELGLYDPNFQAQRYGVRTAYASGKDAANNQSLNTLTAHLGTLNDAMQAVSSGDVQAVNRGIQFIQNELGDPRITNFDLAKTAVANELATALKGSATDQEIKDWSNGIQRAGSPAQMQAAIRTPMELMAGRLGMSEQKYRNTMGEDPGNTVIYPYTRNVFQKFGVPLLNAGAGVSSPQVKSTLDKIFHSQQ